MKSSKTIFLNNTDTTHQEPPIIQEFRELYGYVRLLGQHVKLLHTRLDQIETLITEVDSRQQTSIHEHTVAIAKIHEHIVQQVELNEAIQQMTVSLEQLAS